MNNENWTDLIQNLSFSQGVNLARQIVERMLPAYIYFSKNNSFGNPTILEKSLENTNFQANLEFLESQLDEICPDMDDFSGDLWATAALDTVGVLAEFLKMQSQKDLSYLSVIIDIALNVPYMCGEETENREYELFKNWIFQIQNNQKLEKPAYDWINYIKAVA